MAIEAPEGIIKSHIGNFCKNGRETQGISPPKKRWCWFDILLYLLRNLYSDTNYKILTIGSNL
jgi:hypothetical protein